MKKLFIVLVLIALPLSFLGVAFDKIFRAVKTAEEEAYQVFFRQDHSKECILLADKGGSAFLLCLPEEGNTHLISIIPDSCPKGEINTTFISIYQKTGMDGLIEKIEGSLSCSVDGYLLVEFSGIAAIVDALEGVELEGKLLSGKGLQAYLKNIPSDCAGAEMQQNVILAIGRRFCSAGFWKGQNALRKLMKVTDTNLSVGELIKLGKILIPALEGKGLYRHYVPKDGQWQRIEEMGLGVGISAGTLMQDAVKNG